MARKGLANTHPLDPTRAIGKELGRKVSEGVVWANLGFTVSGDDAFGWGVALDKRPAPTVSSTLGQIR